MVVVVVIVTVVVVVAVAVVTVAVVVVVVLVVVVVTVVGSLQPVYDVSAYSAAAFAQMRVVLRAGSNNGVPHASALPLHMPTRTCVDTHTRTHARVLPPPPPPPH